MSFQEKVLPVDIELPQLHACLDAIEEQEITLLAWGDCDGFFTEQEILTLLAQVLPEQDPEIVKIELLEHGMLFEVPYQQGILAYRSRMGETVHLYRNLRQWFHGQSLGQTRSLVSDYRFVRRPRSYPKRQYDSQLLLNQWKEEVNLSELELQAMEQLLHPSLSGFQARSTIRICKAWNYHNSHSQTIGSTGTIVCAGTGSGKTLSFYLPALAKLVGDICSNPGNRVRILAIYPRKELLKDQFMETWSQCRKLDDLMIREVGRKLRIGAFYGDTPYDQYNALKTVNTHGQNGLSFDLLRCGKPNCSGVMIWPKSSIEQKQEELVCNICGHQVDDNEVGLTRNSLSTNVPDILFTTTEMLNQHLGNNYQNHLFGVGYKLQGPPLVLLDEVHTYGGNTGAQTAFLLRRWMQRSYCRPHFVGLSATLADAEAFFAQLIGADHSRVELVEPKPDEIEDKYAEYLLALRGDPVSQTALLSTTIQTAMLTRRMLDPIQQPRSKGCWGSKSFIFTDDLDVTNRLYHQLADAEGWRTSYRGLQPNSTPLAHLREPDFDQRKIDLGQNWRMAQDIGYSLSADDRALVARTSSQDAGVDPHAEVVVATASLEVGFNDPLVGAVIQHKAPRDVASYLQRKGRAGRPTTMRPWMLVVLSEFGRDRVAFQRYEELITPEIKRQGLPLHNGHIQKMQAAMATLDWLSTRLGKNAIWSVLKAPQKYASVCAKLGKLVEEVLTPGEVQEKFISYLGWSLKLDDASLQHVLWAPPRSVMLEYLPTLHRLLTTQWREQGKAWGALTRNRSPLPKFIPDALFSQLNQPTLGIALQRGQAQEIKWESLSFHQGLREFAPGRISKRYATSSNYNADWLIPGDFQPTPDMDMRIPFNVQDAFGERLNAEGEVNTVEGEVLRVMSPSEIYTSHLPIEFNLTEKSNSILHWHVAFNSTNSETVAHDPPIGCWQKSLLDITFYSHGQMTPLEVTRYTTGSFASMRFKRGGSAHVHFDWQMGNKPIGIGDRQWVDGAQIRFKITSNVLTELLDKPLIMRALRPLYFQHCISNLDYFENDSFTASWLAECYLAALALELVGCSSPSSNTEKNIKAGLANLHTTVGLDSLLAIPLSLFQPDEQQVAEGQSLHESLCQHLSNQQLLKQLHNCAEVLWQDLNTLPGFDGWLRQILANTLAGATQQMLCVLLPDVEERAVVADAVWENDVLEVWITETEGGGSGIINRLSRTYYEDSVYLLNILVRCLQASDYEQIDFDLYALLEMLEQDAHFVQLLDNVRFAKDHDARREATSNLHEELKEAGFALSHSFMSVLFSRIIRPGSNKQTDSDLLELLRKWNSLEDISGLEWGMNIAAHTLASHSFQGANITPSELFDKFCLYQGLLWPRGSAIRQSELGYFSPFLNGQIITERLLGAALFDDHTPQVNYQVEDWLLSLHNAIREVGRVELVIERQDIKDISAVIAHLQTESLEHLGLFLYPRIRSVRRAKGQVLLRVEMAEMLQ